MKLYEINEAIENVFSNAVDPETGEITADAETLAAELEKLNGERKSVLEWVAKSALNARAEAEALKAEEARLKARRDKLAKKEARMIEVLDRECGEKTDLGVATLSYRKTERVDVLDSTAAVTWLEQNGFDSAVKYAQPEIIKANVKKLIKTGAEVPGVAITAGMSVTLK